ncbi:glycosyltransferase family 2 protein [Blastopirellula marina]|uniref:Glycosyltransferase family 2 protein n=1 Tax=Blastopirellula marina TaxID=124 RepID=A0A2S8GB54_9BACT|nr:glycosyltransferase family 2 protein [Blastopirellula marina]PQO41685.1 glycosyltransferase family 2 protein [Blastopirellula marina]PTL46128.1 glycosyltransferase family 2 protein [Blastopirellula marina]
MTASLLEHANTNHAQAWEPTVDHSSDSFDLSPWEFRLAETEDLASELTTTNQDDRGELDYSLPNEFKLSVIVPVYNEEDTIATIVSRLMQLPIRTEIVIVDDGSTDATRDVLARLAHFCDLKILYHSRNQGKGAAIRTAIPNTTGDIVVIQDADLEYDPKDLIQVIRPLVNGEADVSYGSRYLSKQPQAKRSSLLHRLGNQTLTCLSNCLTGLHLSDMETCYKAFPRSIIQRIPIQQNRFGFEPEITAKLAKRRYRFQECPIQYRARDWSEGKEIGWKDALSTLWCIIRYRFVD